MGQHSQQKVSSMKTDIHGHNFEPQAIRTSTIHSRIEGKRCIEGCMACGGKGQIPGDKWENDMLCLTCGGTGGKMPETPKQPSTIIHGPSPGSEIPNWRSMTIADYDQFLEWVDTNTLNRWNLGKERYQSDVKGFQGDPIDHAIEEMFDGLLYLWMAKRRQEECGG